MRSRSALAARLFAAALWLCAASPLHAQEPATRAEAWHQRRVEKSRHLEPYKPGKLEKALLKIENDRFLERLFEPSSGFYPRLGSFHSGGGFGIGPGWKATGLAGNRVDVNISSALTFKRYWIAEALVAMPRLAHGWAFLEGYARRRDLPQEDFFGIGPDSIRSQRVNFAYRDTTIGGAGGANLARRVAVGGRIEYLAPSAGRGTDELFPSIERIFSDHSAPGLAAQPDYLRYGAFIDVNYREPIGNPRAGGRYQLAFNRYNDRDLDRYSFNRVDIEVEQYLSILKQRRVLALHGLVSLSDTDAGHVVPFYLQRTLGGSNTLRGFREYRFRDENLLLLQAEYRWEVFTGLDAALFYDAGKVVPRREDIDLKGLESDYGFGFRFGTIHGVFMRIDAAFGSQDGKHFFLKFGHVF